MKSIHGYLQQLSRMISGDLSDVLPHITCYFFLLQPYNYVFLLYFYLNKQNQHLFYMSPIPFLS